MEHAKIEVFTSPTCPHCPKAKANVDEFAKGRDDIRIIHTNTGTSDGARRAQQFDVRSVPTIFVTGPGYPDRIGYIGVPSKDRLGKLVDIALGKEEWKEEEPVLKKIADKLKIRW